MPYGITGTKMVKSYCYRKLSFRHAVKLINISNQNACEVYEL